MCVGVCCIECLQFRNLACASAVFGFHGSNAKLLLSQIQISQVSPHLMEDIELTEGNALFMTCIHKIVKKCCVYEVKKRLFSLHGSKRSILY